MAELNTTLGVRSQTFIDLKDAINTGLDKGELRTREDIYNFIMQVGYEPEDYIETNEKYKKIVEEGGNPRDVGLGELVFKSATKSISDTAIALSNKVPITKNLGKLFGDGTKDWWSNYSDPWTPPGAKELTKEIIADIGQGAIGIAAVANIVPRLKSIIPGKADKVDVKKIKKLGEAASKISRLRTFLKRGTYNTAIAAGGLTLAFNPDEATLDILKKSFPKTVEWSGMEPVFDALAVNPEDPKALQYVNQFAQELIAAGVIMTPIAITGLLIRAARNSRKIKAKEDGIDSPIETTKNKGDDTIANQADQEKVIVNEVVDNPDTGFIKRILVSKPISEYLMYVKEYFKSTRNIGDDAYDLWITKSGTPKVIREKIASNIREFRRSIKAEYNSSKFSKLSKDIQEKINNIMVLDKDNPAYQKLFNRNIDAIRPVIKKQLDAENAKRVAEGKKKIPVKNYNTKLKELTEAEALKHTDGYYHFQRNKLLKTLKPRTRKIVQQLRQEVDDHSRYLKNSGVLNPKLSRIFGANDKFYLQRSYEIMENPAVSRNLNKAWHLLLQGKENISKLNQWRYATEINKLETYHRYLQSITGLSKEEIPNIIKRAISKKGAEEMMGYFNMIHKNYGNPNILKHRKIFSKELRDLWGERTNPLTRYSLTMNEIGKLSAQVKFLKDLKTDGLNKGYLWASEPIALPKISKKIKPTDDLKQVEYKLDATDKVHLGRLERGGGLQLPEVFKSPLEGIFANKDFASGLTRGLTDDVILGGGPWAQLWRGVTSFSKMTGEMFKTVYSPITQNVNFFGNWNFAAVLGGFNPIQFSKNLRRITTLPFLRGKEFNKWFDKRIKLGMIDQSVNANQMKAYLKDISEGTGFFGTATKKTIDTLLIPFKLPIKIYQGADSVMRATVFDSLRSAVRRLEPTLKDMPIINNRTLDDVLDHFIAERVRMRMPTWAMVPKGIKGLKDMPLIGAFPSWFVEVLRTTNRTIQGIGRDLSGKSIDDLARHSGFKSADDMLEKTGYNLRTNKKVMGYLRGKGMWSLGAGTGLALGYDALNETSRLTYNISEKANDSFNYLVDFYAATPKVFTNAPEWVHKHDPRTDIVTRHLIYSYRDPARLDVWQALKSPIRRMIRTIKMNEDLTDSQLNREYWRIFTEFAGPIFGYSIVAQTLLDVYHNKPSLFPEGSGERELRELIEQTLGPNKGFSPGFLTELWEMSQSGATEYNLKNFGVQENVFEWDGKGWLNKGVRDPEGVKPGIETPLASKHEPGTLWKAIVRGEFDKIDKNTLLANIGLQTKQVDITKLLKFKISPLWYEKKQIKKDFIRDLIKMKTLGIDEDRLLTYWRDTLEKHYQADRQLANLSSKFKTLGLTDKMIATGSSYIRGTNLQIKEKDITQLLIGRYNNSQLLPTTDTNQNLSRILKEAGIKLDPDAPLINKMTEIWKLYNNKKFEEE